VGVRQMPGDDHDRADARVGRRPMKGLPDHPLLVIVQWDDIKGKADWVHAEDVAGFNKRCRCVTVGYVLVDDEETLLVAGSRNNNGSWGDLTRIPRGVVRSVKRLTVRTDIPAEYRSGRSGAVAHVKLGS
jgi:hypothetical protein